MIHLYDRAMADDARARALALRQQAMDDAWAALSDRVRRLAAHLVLRLSDALRRAHTWRRPSDAPRPAPTRRRLSITRAKEV